MGSKPRRYSVDVSWQGSAGRGPIGVVGTYEFGHHQLSDDERVSCRGREITAHAIQAVDAVGDRYRLAGPPRIDTCTAEATFVVVQQGILVGPGRLNNALFDLTIRVTERDEGAGRAEVLELLLDPSS
jgi:hypothetical protein